MEGIERQVRWAGGVAAHLVLAAIYRGLWRGLRQPIVPHAGCSFHLLRRPLFYLLASAGYFGLCQRLWHPLPLQLSRPLRVVALFLGPLLYFPGLALVLWGRLELGRMYNVSGSFGAQLYEEHDLVTTGPYARLRHPMYLGLLLATVGGLLLYRTWTFIFFLANLPALLLRARREERALAAAFGPVWDAYCQQVPPWLPRLPEG